MNLSLKTAFGLFYFIVLCMNSLDAAAVAVGIPEAKSCSNLKLLNPHCRAVCRLQAENKLNADGTFNQCQLISEITKSWGLEYEAGITTEILNCIHRYGPYNATENCHGIEKFLACLDDINLKQCNARNDRTSEKCNTWVSRFDCQGKTFHWPSLYLEAFDDCTSRTNSSYMRLRCQWKESGKFKEDYSQRLERALEWAQMMFGNRLGSPVAKAVMDATAHIDLPNTSGVATDENAIDLLYDFMVSKREAYYQTCGPLTMDRFSTPVL